MFSDGDDSVFREAMDAVSLTHLLASKLGANPLTRDAAERIRAVADEIATKLKEIHDQPITH